MILDKNYYLDTFAVSIPELENVLYEAQRSGGDYVDFFFENTSNYDIILRDGEVSNGGFNIDFGVGIRVLKGEKTGYAYSESTDNASLLAAARAAASISSSTLPMGGNGAWDKPSSPRFIGKPNPAADRYPMAKDWRSSDLEFLSDYLVRLQNSINAKDNRVIKVIAIISSQVSDILMYNSHGELKFDTRPMGTISVSAVFSQNGKVENKNVSRSFRSGWEMLSDELLEEIACKVVEGIDESFEAGRPKGGRMSVVMAAGASGILLHEAMGHAFEADFNRKGQSIFSDKMGKQVCPKGITIVDDATIKANRGALNYDDEGVPGQRTCMVEDGILTSYLHDRISADYYGVRPTGNGRRESFRYHPIPRMRSTYMEAGEASKEDIIASVKKGIFVDQFSNGQVKIGEGDFTFYVKRGFLIENGRLTAPVKDLNIIGNGPEALANIEMVGNDLEIEDCSWTCGKEQSAPVSCGIPTVLIKNLTVGGE